MLKFAFEELSKESASLASALPAMPGPGEHITAETFANLRSRVPVTDPNKADEIFHADAGRRRP